jgi:hypothetical protein
MEEENTEDVRREDQNNINQFAQLNARLHEVLMEQADLKVSVLRHPSCLSFRKMDKDGTSAFNYSVQGNLEFDSRSALFSHDTRAARPTNSHRSVIF